MDSRKTWNQKSWDPHYTLTDIGFMSSIFYVNTTVASWLDRHRRDQKDKWICWPDRDLEALDWSAIIRTFHQWRSGCNAPISEKAHYSAIDRGITTEWGQTEHFYLCSVCLNSLRDKWKPFSVLSLLYLMPS